MTGEVYERDVIGLKLAGECREGIHHLGAREIELQRHVPAEIAEPRGQILRVAPGIRQHGRVLVGRIADHEGAPRGALGRLDRAGRQGQRRCRHEQRQPRPPMRPERAREERSPHQATLHELRREPIADKGPLFYSAGMATSGSATATAGFGTGTSAGPPNALSLRRTQLSSCATPSATPISGFQPRTRSSLRTSLM